MASLSFSVQHRILVPPTPSPSLLLSPLLIPSDGRSDPWFDILRTIQRYKYRLKLEALET